MNKNNMEPRKVSDVIRSHSYLLPILAAFIAALTPAGYLFGLGYQAGYLHVFGITTDAFPLSITEAYVNGYYAATFYFVDIFSFLVNIDTWKWVGWSLLGVLFLIYIMAKLLRYYHPESAQCQTVPARLKSLYEWLHPKNNDFTLALIFIKEVVTKVSMVAYLIVVLMLIWISVTTLSVTKGEQHALNTKKHFVLHGCTFQDKTQITNCVQVLDGANNLIAEGLLITMNATRYALFTDQGPVIAELPTKAKVIRKFDLQAYSAMAKQ